VTLTSQQKTSKRSKPRELNRKSSIIRAELRGPHQCDACPYGSPHCPNRARSKPCGRCARNLDLFCGRELDSVLVPLMASKYFLFSSCGFFVNSPSQTASVQLMHCTIYDRNEFQTVSSILNSLLFFGERN
jgi:hypothetical protein